MNPVHQMATAAWARALEPLASAPVDAYVGSDVQSLFSLAGKVAVLTDVGGGGSRGIAHMLASAGARVVIADRVTGPAETYVEEIRGLGGVAAAVDADIETEGSVVAVFEAVVKAAGRLDILVNCAGMSANQPLTETSLEVWDDMQSLNLRANFLCMREAVKRMVQVGEGGRIVNVTSICAAHPVMNGNASYAAARLGVTGLGRSAALDYVGAGILVNTVLAGPVMNKVAMHPQIVEKLRAGQRYAGPMSGPGRLPLGYGDMADVAAAVLYLVSPAGRYVTGQSLVLDGGFMLT